MYYVKAEIAEGIVIKAVITNENVFTICPECGAEHQVDLSDAVIDGQLDLYGTATYCPECSEKRAGRMRKCGSSDVVEEPDDE